MFSPAKKIHSARSQKHRSAARQESGLLVSDGWKAVSWRYFVEARQSEDQGAKVIADFMLVLFGIFLGSAGTMIWMDLHLKKSLTKIERGIDLEKCNLLKGSRSKKSPVKRELPSPECEETKRGGV